MISLFLTAAQIPFCNKWCVFFIHSYDGHRRGSSIWAIAERASINTERCVGLWCGVCLCLACTCEHRLSRWRGKPFTHRRGLHPSLELSFCMSGVDVAVRAAAFTAGKESRDAWSWLEVLPWALWKGKMEARATEDEVQASPPSGEDGMLIASTFRCKWFWGDGVCLSSPAHPAIQLLGERKPLVQRRGKAHTAGLGCNIPSLQPHAFSLARDEAS